MPPFGSLNAAFFFFTQVLSNARVSIPPLRRPRSVALFALCTGVALLVAGDGSKIAFQTDRDGHDEVYTISADGPGTPGQPDGRPRL